MPSKDGRFRRHRAVTEQRFDDRHDAVAMRDQPARDGVNERADQSGTERRRAEAEQDRATERVVEFLDGNAAEAAVQPFHHRYDDRASRNDAQEESGRFAFAAAWLRHARTIDRRKLAARTEAARCERHCQQHGNAADDPARAMREIVVRIVGQGVISGDVNGDVRDRCGDRDRAQPQRCERPAPEPHSGRLRTPAWPRTSPSRLAARRRSG